MAAATKVAAFGAMLRIFVALPELRDDWRPVLWAVAILTDGGRHGHRRDPDRRQTDAGVFGGGAFRVHPDRRDRRQRGGLSSTLFYLRLRVQHTGAFAVVGLVRNATGDEDTAMSRWAGLGRRYPLVGVVFSLFLLAFAGIPLTSGFVSKFAVFRPPARAAPSRWSSSVSSPAPSPPTSTFG